jgi:GNAT superfamily N-acetyltransferase
MAELLRPSYRESTEWGGKSLDEECVAQVDCSRWLDNDDRTLFVAEDGGELIGVVTGGLTEGPPICDRGLAVNCDGLWVVPDRRREGIARSSSTDSPTGGPNATPNCSS